MALSAALTAKQFADLVGIGTRQVDNLVVEGLPRVRRGRRWMYPASRCVQWYLKHKLEHAKKERGAGRGDQTARDRKLLADAKLAEFELAERERAMLTIADIEREISGILRRLRATLLASPQKFAPRIVGLRSIPEALVALEPCCTELMAACARAGDDVENGEHVDGA